MTDSEKKETVESPTSGEKAIVQKAKEPELVRGFDSIFDDFRRSFDNLMAPFVPMRTFIPRAAELFPVRAPLIDVIDEGNQYVVNTELPGFDKDEVDIQVNKDFMVLKAEKKSEKEEKSENYLHRERSYSACERTVNFPEEVDPAKVEGTMENGVLRLKIPKKEPKPEERMRRVELK
jgi:HSP20 family protein